MSRGNPYGTDSFPAHERLTRALLARQPRQHAGAIARLGRATTRPAADLRGGAAAREVDERLRRRCPWAALLVSEQTRQFHAYKDIAERFLPHVFGAVPGGDRRSTCR